MKKQYSSDTITVIMDQVSQVREKIDIVALISEYLPLKKMGRNFKTNCPFHGEKTPSFVVSPERQIWHCFGCQKGGDVFTFLMEYENLEFPEALRTLAKKAGIELSGQEYTSGVSSKKEKMYTINHQAMEFYHFVLTQHKAGEKALWYLTKKRGISEKVIETFMLGFAPGVGSALCTYLQNKKHHSTDDILQAGLGMQRGSGIADFFSKRIMFALFDHRNNVIGFSGRIMEDGNLDSPKYVNTRETLVYHKGSVFFGLNIAKDEIKKEQQAIIMEGEFDVMSAFQEGIGNAVAVKGTALTENQAALIARFTPKVSLCFDTDKAGQEAIKHSIPPLEKKGLTTTVIIVPNGKDPDEILHTDPSLFKKAVKNDIGVYDYLLEKSVSSFDKQSAEGKKKITEELLPFLEGIDNEIVKEHYVKKLAVMLDTSFESMLRQLERVQKKEEKESILGKIKEKKPRDEILEEYLLALILQYKNPKVLLLHVKILLSDFSFTIPANQQILESLFSFFEKNDNFDHEKFLKTLPPEILSGFDTCYLLPLPVFLNDAIYEEEVKKVATDLKSMYIRKRIKLLGDTIEKIEKDGKEGQLEQVQAEFSRLITLIPDSN